MKRMQITRRDYARVENKLRKHARDAERDEARTQNMVSTLTESLEVAGTATLIGVLSGRYGALSLGPVPLDLITGIALNVAGMYSSDKWANHLHNIGNGALAAYGVKLGAGLGTEWRIRADQPPFVTSGNEMYGAGPMGAMGPGYGAWSQGGGLTEADLQAMYAAGAYG